MKRYKIAIQFYGHLRSFQKTFYFFKKNILDVNNDIDIDIFIHTWDELEHIETRRHYQKDFEIAGLKITNKHISFLKKNYKPKALKITPQLEFSPEQKELIHKNGFEIKNYLAIYNVSYSMQEVNTLRKNYGQKYDLILLTRLDIIFLRPLIFKPALESRINAKWKAVTFSNEEFENVVFYTYMEKEIPINTELFRNQNLYITGIDLFALAGEKAMDTLCSWHNKVLNQVPINIEWWLTKQIRDYKLDISLMYYKKPECWTILRTNQTNTDLPNKNEMCVGGGIMLNQFLVQIEQSKKKWDFNQVCIFYEKALLENNHLIFEYLGYLADIGRLNKIKELCEKYTFSYLESLITLNHHKSDLGKMILKLMEKMNENLYEVKGDDIESNLIFLVYNKDFSSLKEILNQDFCFKDEGYLPMIVNWAINELIDKDTLDLSIFAKTITLYVSSNKINNTRKTFVLKSCFDYFYDKNKNLISLDSKIILKMNHLFVALAQDEELSKNYSQKLYEILKLNCQALNQLSLAAQNQILTKNISKNKIPKIAVLLCGQVRGNFNAVYDIFNKNILKPLNADLFIFSWDTYLKYPGLAGSAYAGNDWAYRYAKGVPCPRDVNNTNFIIKNMPHFFAKINTRSEPSPVQPSLFENLLNTKKILIENEEDFDKKYGHIGDGALRTMNQLKMFYGIYTLFKELLKYEKEKGIEYDFIIRLRHDVAVYGEFNVSKLEYLSNDEVVVDFGWYGVQEQFYLGRKEAISKIIDIWEDIVKAQNPIPYPKEISDVHSAHYMLYFYCVIHNLFVKKSPYRRDLSVFLNDLERPDVREEIKKDFLNASEELKNRDEVWDFFEKAFNLFLPRKRNIKLNFGATQRIHNHLSYKLGQIMIRNSKSLYGFIKLPFLLMALTLIHKEQEKIYKEKIKANPNLALPPLESYPDYNEALKEKECFTYKLGSAFMKGFKSWYKGGLVKFYFEAKALEREFKSKKAKQE